MKSDAAAGEEFRQAAFCHSLAPSARLEGAAESPTKPSEPTASQRRLAVFHLWLAGGREADVRLPLLSTLFGAWMGVPAQEAEVILCHRLLCSTQEKPP